MLKTQLNIMLQLQEQMNSKVDPAWRANNNEWYRAIWVEAAEMLDHYGWKWWKAQTLDRDQVLLELIDIFHFGLSDELQKANEGEYDLVAEKMLARWHAPLPEGDFRAAIEEFTLNTLSTKSFDLSGFIKLMALINLEAVDLFKMYVSKNVLNIFRQDHGYRSGSYIKVWNGKEDNEVLIELLDQLDPGAATFQQDLYQGLEARYPK